MGFQRAPHNSTEQYEEKGVLSGKRDAIYLRNKYQTELDNSHAAFINMVHFIEEENTELENVYNTAMAFKEDIKAHETERINAYTALGNKLTKETDFEKWMWDKTQKGKKVKTIKIKQNIRDSDVEEMKYDSMLDYLKQYPTISSKSSFTELTEKINKVETDLREEKKKYNHAVAKANSFLPNYKVWFAKADDKLGAYNKILEEGTKKLAEARYNKGIFKKLASQREKEQTELNTLQHRMEQFSKTLEILKEKHKKYAPKQFEELKY